MVSTEHHITRFSQGRNLKSPLRSSHHPTTLPSFRRTVGDGIFCFTWVVLFCFISTFDKGEGYGKIYKVSEGFSCCWCVKVIYNRSIKGKHQTYVNFYTVFLPSSCSLGLEKSCALQTQWIVSKSLRFAIGRVWFLYYTIGWLSALREFYLWRDAIFGDCLQDFTRIILIHAIRIISIHVTFIPCFDIIQVVQKLKIYHAILLLSFWMLSEEKDGFPVWNCW